MRRKAFREPSALLPPPPTRAKRNRAWEKKHNVDLVHYRGVPRNVQEEVIAIASDLGVTVGEVARAMLEHGITSYKAGKMLLHPEVTTGKVTLFPQKGKKR